MRKFGLVLAICGASALMGGCGDDEGGQEPIKVGVALASTGPLSAFIPLFIDAATLAGREVNAAGGLLGGRSVEFVIEDTATDPTVARTKVTELLQQGVVGIIGPNTSDSALNTEDLTEASRVPQISPTASAASLSSAQPQTDRYFFRTIPSDVLQAAVLALAAEDLGCKALGIMHSTDVYGTGFPTPVQARFEAEVSDGSVVGTTPFAVNQTAYRTEVDAMAALSPDCIALASFAGDAGNIIREWNEASHNGSVIWLLTEAALGADLFTNVVNTAYLSEARGVTPAAIRSHPDYNRFAAEYQAAFGRAPALSSWGYDAVAVLLLAIEYAGTTDGAAVRDALYQVSRPGTPAGMPIGASELTDGLEQIRLGSEINYEGASGPIDFDDFGDVISDYEVRRFNTTSSNFEVVSTVFAAEISGS